MTALHFAVMLGNIPCVDALVKYGADVNLTVKSGIWKDKTGKDIAESCGYDEILDIFNKGPNTSEDDEAILNEYDQKEAALLKMLSEARAQNNEEESNQVQEMQSQINKLTQENTGLSQLNDSLSQQLKTCMSIIASLRSDNQELLNRIRLLEHPQ